MGAIGDRVGHRFGWVATICGGGTGLLDGGSGGRGGTRNDRLVEQGEIVREALEVEVCEVVGAGRW